MNLFSFIKSTDSDSMKPLLKDLTLTILYDNYYHGNDLETDWGFSCLIEGLDKTVLFDTGGKGKLLLENMKKMDKDPKDVDILILSHNHGDHTGGMKMFLEKNNEIVAYVPQSFPDDFHNSVEKSGATLKKVTGPLKIIENLYTTGEMGSSIIEQSIVITTPKGNMVITGCAHPGIDKIVDKARDIAGDDVLIAMGGFHLLRTGKSEVESIINKFKEEGVNYTAPTHCSGDKTIEAFESKYGDHFIKLGVGKVIKLSDL